MIDTFAQLLSDVLQGLGYPPKDVLPVEDAARAARDRLALRGLHLTQSGERWDVSRYDYTPSESQREKDLSGTTVGVPLWIERRVGAAPDERYDYIPACDLATVEEARARGDERAAFFKEDGKLKVRLSLNPDGSTVYRVRHYRNPLGLQTAQDALAVPAQFVPFISAEAQLDVIPTILRNLAADKDNPPAKEVLDAWGATVIGLNKIADDWLPLWTHHRLRGKGGARGRNRRGVLG